MDAQHIYKSPFPSLTDSLTLWRHDTTSSVGPASIGYLTLKQKKKNIWLHWRNCPIRDKAKWVKGITKFLFNPILFDTTNKINLIIKISPLFLICCPFHGEHWKHTKTSTLANAHTACFKELLLVLLQGIIASTASSNNC